MKTRRLLRVECFRFSRFLGVFFIMLALFLLSLYWFAAKGDVMGAEMSSAGESLYLAIGMGNLLVPLFACVMTGVYIGREFERKTINYEIMQGYGTARICLAKILTCGMIAPMTVFICMVLLICLMQGEAGAYSAGHFAAMLILMFRVFVCSVLYVMLMESGIYGGIFAFIRYTILDEALLLFLNFLRVSKGSGKLKLAFSFLTEWGMASGGSRRLEGQETAVMFVGTAAECLLLVALIYVKDHYGIKEG